MVTYAQLRDARPDLWSVLTSTITELETIGTSIVPAAQTMSSTDQAAATGTSRIATALNGLGKPPE